MLAQLTAGFDLPDVVTGEPARFAIECALPPSSLLLPRHKDHVTFVEWQLILVVLLKVEASLHHLPTSTILRHLLLERSATQTQISISKMISMYVHVYSALKMFCASVCRIISSLYMGMQHIVTCAHKQWMHKYLDICRKDHTTDLDCLRREPLDLAEESACEDVDWLGDAAPDCGHDLSAAQSRDKHRGNTNFSYIPVSLVLSSSGEWHKTHIVIITVDAGAHTLGADNLIIIHVTMVHCSAEPQDSTHTHTHTRYTVANAW